MDENKVDLVARAVLEHVALGIVVADPRGRIIRVNRQVESLLGFAERELVGEDIRTFGHPLEVEQNENLFLSLEKGEVDRISMETRLRALTGRYLWMRVTMAAARDSEGRVELVITTLEDIDESRRMKDALRTSDDRYRTLVRHLPNTAVILFDLDLRCVLADGEQLFAALGTTPGDLLGCRLVDISTAKNRELMEKTYQGTLAGKRETVEFQRNGRDLVVHTTPVRDESGVITGGMVLLYDITRQKQAENALRAQSAAMKLVEDIATAANQARTATEAFQFVLERVATHMGWPVGHAFIREGEELVPTGVWYLQDPARMQPFVEATRQTRFARGIALGRILDRAHAMWMLDIGATEGYVRRAAAEEVGLMTALAFPVLVGTEVVGVLEFDHTSRVVPDEDLMILMANIGTQIGRVVERERYASEMRTLSLRDELTGLLNRRGFMELGQRQHGRGLLESRPFTLIFADLNGMKPINDQLGHEAGDSALRDVAEILRKTFREGVDLVARLGGDEFVILADGASRLQAVRLEQRVRDSLAAFNASGVRPYRLSLSLGVAHFDPATPKPLGTLLADADGAMYAQKRARKANVFSSLVPLSSVSIDVLPA